MLRSLISCSPYNDSYCRLSFGSQQNPQYTGQYNGIYDLQTDDIPGEWNIAIAADSDCSVGASTGDIWLTTTGTTIYCGNISDGSAIASPSSCTETLNNTTGQYTSNCPATITLTTSASVFPTATSLDVGAYNDFGTQESSFSGQAAGGTSIVVPTPTQPGNNVLVITDPSTNQVVAAALFTINQVIENPCGNKKSC